jgi:hypothetical protein
LSFRASGGPGCHMQRKRQPLLAAVEKLSCG